MRIKKFDNNKLYKYEDLCYALDKEVEQTKRQIEQVKSYFKRNPVKGGYSGKKLNGCNWLANFNGKLQCLSRRDGFSRAEFMAKIFVDDVIMLEEINRGEREPYQTH